MIPTDRDLYARYVRAISFYNEAAAQSRAGGIVDGPLFKLRSEVEFRDWWLEVSRDEDLQRRWLERFADPAASFAKSCECIHAALTQATNQRIAA